VSGAARGVLRRPGREGIDRTPGVEPGTLASRMAPLRFAVRARLLTVFLMAMSACLLAEERPVRESSDGGGASETGAALSDSGASDEESSSSSSGTEQDQVFCSQFCEVRSDCGSDSFSQCMETCRSEAERESFCADELAVRNQCVGAFFECAEYSEWFSGNPCSGEFYPCQNEDYDYHICTEFSC
jgi:hypothetical protein